MGCDPGAKNRTPSGRGPALSSLLGKEPYSPPLLKIQSSQTLELPWGRGTCNPSVSLTSGGLAGPGSPAQGCDITGLDLLRREGQSHPGKKRAKRPSTATERAADPCQGDRNSESFLLPPPAPAPRHRARRQRRARQPPREHAACTAPWTEELVREGSEGSNDRPSWPEPSPSCLSAAAREEGSPLRRWPATAAGGVRGLGP